MRKSTCAIPATFTSSGHGSTSACRVWSTKSPRPSWTRRTGRRVPIPTLHGATSRLRSTWCRRERPLGALRNPRTRSKPGVHKMSEHTQVDGIYPFPALMQTRTIETNGASIHVRVGGHGPTVVMLHGFGTTGDMWGHLASALIEEHMVVAPDLRGLGLSSKPDGGYEKKNQAADVMGVLDALGVRTAELVTHDIGVMVGFALAATQPERVSRWVAIDAPLPGVGLWDQIKQNPAMWHFGFGGPDMERLVAGRERLYLDRFWNDLSRDPKRFDESKRQHYAALYAQPGAIRAGFAQFLTFGQDAADNRTFLARGKLQMPVLGSGGEATFGPMIGAVMRCVADNVEDVIIPDCGHWITEEQPQATTDLVVDFLHRCS